MSFKQDNALLVNPEDWTPKQLQQWLRRYEKGRFQALAPKLRTYSGYDVVQFSSERWATLEPRQLATSLRYTLLGMVQVANQSTLGTSSCDLLTITTDFTPCGLPSPRRHTSPQKKNGPRKPVQFPPMIEVPSFLTSSILILIVIGVILALTVLKSPLDNIGISSHNLIRYGSIPLISVGFTYIHIWLALYLTFYPLTYIGCLQIPNTNTGLGWQGIVPNKAEKMARQAVQLLTKQLLRVQDVFSKLEPNEIVQVLEPLLFGTIREVIEQMALKYSPDLWNVLSEEIKEEIVEKIKEEVPQHIEGLMEEIKINIEDIFDLEEMVVQQFTSDKQLLVNMFIMCGYQELAFIRNSGATMGFIFGVLQMGLSFIYSNKFIVFPVFGLIVGIMTNWLALKMIFEPVEPKKVCGITFHGLFLRRQEQVANVYGRIVTSEMLTSRNLIEGLLKGPASDRMFELVYDNVQMTVNDSLAATEAIAHMGLGNEMYIKIKQDVTDHIVNQFPESLRQIEDYAHTAMDLETTIREKMKLLTSSEFEQLLHPIFQEDEWKLVVMGGVLGLMIGLLQVYLINE